ncbi:YhgE/Pip domain-containing protein, partial [Aquipuribacter hungaricus]
MSTATPTRRAGVPGSTGPARAAHAAGPAPAARRPCRRLATLGGLALVPAVVAGAVAWGLPDPASNLDRIEAAVVNLDEPVTVQGETVPLGRQVVAALTAGVGLDGEPLPEVDGEGLPSDLTWTLTDADGAEDGLAEGRYAAVVTIPEDFSAAATSLSATDPADATGATVDVRTAEAGPVGDGAVAALVGGVVAATLGEELTTTYLDGLYVGFSGVRTSLSEAAAGAGEIGTGSGELADGLAATDEGARQLADGLDGLSDGTAELADGSDQLASGAGASAEGAQALADGLAQLRDGTAALPGSTSQLAEGADGVGGGTEQLATQLGTFATTLGTAATGAAPLPDALTGLSGAATAVDQGAAGVSTGAAALQADAAAALEACEAGGGDCAALEALAADAA